MAGVIISGDTSGSVTLSAPAVAGTVTVTLPSTSGTMAVLPTATGVLTEANGGTGTTTGYYGFKNRIINGAMVIDQRNAGASITNVAGGNNYAVDRFDMFGAQASKFTAQQNAASVTPPAGFKTYLGITSSSAYTVGASESFSVRQRIEGFNTADLGFGSASASPVTLSFWVRSSLTGAFGGCFYNASADRFYPFTYSISSANTWEQKTVTVAGDTTGTWVGATNAIGLVVQFSLGAGASVSGTAGAWTGSVALQPTGSTSVVGTNGATFYITGVQLEKGSTATSFDYRPIGTELALCQRYCQVIGGGASGQWWSAASPEMAIIFPVNFRSAPTYTMFTSSVSVSEVATATRTSTTAAAQGGTLTTNGGNVRIDGFTGATQFRGALCLTNCFLFVSEL